MDEAAREIHRRRAVDLFIFILFALAGIVVYYYRNYQAVKKADQAEQSNAGQASMPPTKPSSY